MSSEKFKSFAIEEIKRDIKLLKEVHTTTLPNMAKAYIPDKEKLMIDVLEKIVKQIEMLEIRSRERVLIK